MAAPDAARQLLERVPPQALETEASVLGAMLLDTEAVGTAIEHLQKDCFYHSAHAQVFEAIVALYERNEPADLTTASEELTRRGQLEKIGGRTFLAGLAEAVATSAHIEYHCRILVEKAALRRLIHAGTEIVTRCYEGVADVEELLEHGTGTVVLTRGMELVLQTCPETLEYLRSRGIQFHIAETREAARAYNELAQQGKAVGGLFHSTC